MEVWHDGWRETRGIPLPGRGSVAKALHRAFQRTYGEYTEPGASIVELLTAPGLGTTTLLWEWIDELKRRAGRDGSKRRAPRAPEGCRLVIAYNFASQPAGDAGQLWSAFVDFMLRRLAPPGTEANVASEHLADRLAAQRCVLVLDGLSQRPGISTFVARLVAELLVRGQTRELECLLVYATEAPLAPATATAMDVERVTLTGLSAGDGAYLLRSIRGLPPAKVDLRLERASDRFGGHLHALVVAGRHLESEVEPLCFQYERFAVFGVTPPDTSAAALVPLAETLGAGDVEARAADEHGATIVMLRGAERLRFIGSLAVDPERFCSRHRMRWVRAAYSPVWSTLLQSANMQPGSPPSPAGDDSRGRVVYVLSCSMTPGRVRSTCIHRTSLMALSEHLQGQRNALPGLDLIYDCGAHLDAANEADLIIVLLCSHLVADVEIHRRLQKLAVECPRKLRLLKVDPIDIGFLAPVQAFTGDGHLSAMDTGARHGILARLSADIEGI